MTLKKEQFEFIINSISDVPGWLTTIEKMWGSHAAGYAERYHTNRIEAIKEAENYYYSTELPKIRKEIKSFREENNDFEKECQERIKNSLSEEFKEKMAEVERLIKNPGNIEKKENIVRELERIDKILNQDISQEMIDRANDHPIENIVEVNRQGYALCVNHADNNPSMYCKNNYAYCFSCGWSGGVISTLMKKERISFKQAINKLLHI